MNPPANPAFSHLRDGLPTMVDVADKPANRRTAVASVRVALGEDLIARFERNELHGPKGPVMQTAIIAGTMAVKNTSMLIPFCHPLPVEHCGFEITLTNDSLVIRCAVTTTGKTGVEMEAMTAASVAALTLYDMAKGIDRGMRITTVELVEKSGGKSGHYLRETSA